jgi:hypothetical protein
VLSAFTGEEGRARTGVRRDRVYVATQYEAAALFAALFPDGGWVYRVLPQGPLEPDPDCTDPELSLACSRALVVEAIPLDYGAQELLADALGGGFGGHELEGRAERAALGLGGRLARHGELLRRRHLHQPGDEAGIAVPVGDGALAQFDEEAEAVRPGLLTR